MGRMVAIDVDRISAAERNDDANAVRALAANPDLAPARTPVQIAWRQGPGPLRTVASGAISVYATLATIVSLALFAFVAVAWLSDLVEAFRSGSIGTAVGIAVIAVVAIGWALLRLLGRFADNERLAETAEGMMTPTAHQALEHDGRPPVVLLRSFADDDILIAGALAPQSLEQIISTRLNGIGPTIAIGKPAEWSPPRGAARDYVGDQDWQQAVASWAGVARLIVAIAGHTGGLRWEIEHIVGRQLQHKLLIIAPPSRESLALRLSRDAADQGALKEDLLTDPRRIAAIGEIVSLLGGAGAATPANNFDGARVLAVFSDAAGTATVLHSSGRREDDYVAAINRAVSQLLGGQAAPRPAS